jgi:hypothetical protein
MHRTTSALLILGVAALAACSKPNPAEVVDDTSTFPIVARWTATSAPIAPATVTGVLSFDQHLGYRSDVTFTVTGPANTAFQWRIFKRDCTVNVAATGPTAFTGVNGVTPIATTQSFPDFTLDAAGKATVKSQVSGWLDSLTQYSVRIRATATTTFNGVNPAACGNLNYAPAN